MSEPSLEKKDTPKSVETTAEPSSKPLAVASAHAFPNLREDQVAMAMKFLSDPRTIASTSSRAQKEQFLRTKGLTDAEINASFQRLDASANTAPPTSSPAVPSGVQLQPVYFPPPPPPPMPPSEPIWLSLLKTVVGAGTALMAGWWLFNRARQDQQQQAVRQLAESTDTAAERDRLLMELLARERERKAERVVEEKSEKENGGESRDDRLVKMLEEMQKNQLKQHADLIMALKEITAATISRSEARESCKSPMKAGGIVMDDEEQEPSRTAENGVRTSAEPSTTVGSEPETMESSASPGEEVDLAGIAEKMDDRMKGTAKMLLGNLVNNPKSDKFRRVNLRTPRFQAQLEASSPARKFMERVGFKEEGSYLVWSPSVGNGSEDELADVKKALELLSRESRGNSLSTDKAQQEAGSRNDGKAAGEEPCVTEKAPLPWMSSAVAATATKVSDAEPEQNGEEETGGIGSLSD
ncbi:hypothetical protein FOZ61_007097 [Perkinsus olseni]|uniref:Peroxisomal membrane protein PEX14 n=1 Tax=Perkinsus olseni TaxID=32597 RepID=A0A7J6MAB9_PEROL|nr:hypothetical protein FOZ61_007097 [Perkinsus olseni]